ncbi:MAG: hypothetical protein MUC50_21075 [Myxococcota bacterium]|jgi:hypothetical protein|nr:hypothetical protein [Myxococcota bacterium]
MHETPQIGQTEQLAARLLGRGGRILGLAAAALSCGQGPGGPWYALPPETLAAVEEILHLLCSCRDDAAMEQAMTRGLLPFPTSAPAFARTLVESPQSIAALAHVVHRDLISAAFGQGEGPKDDLDHGLAALAVALCRSPDALSALAAFLPDDVGSRLERLGRLAHVQAEPGQPSRVRHLLRRVVGSGQERRG